MGRAGSDEAYVVDLCNDLLGEAARRQHRFDWLVGDPSASGTRVKLPVDAYYPGHRVVVEYRERQHDEPFAHFDKPDRLTVSGVHRGEQRRRYDERREVLIPRHGLRLAMVRPSDLGHDSRGRLRRDRSSDLAALRRTLDALDEEDRWRAWAANPLPSLLSASLPSPGAVVDAVTGAYFSAGGLAARGELLQHRACDRAALGVGE